MTELWAPKVGTISTNVVKRGESRNLKKALFQFKRCVRTKGLKELVVTSTTEELSIDLIHILTQYLE